MRLLKTHRVILVCVLSLAVTAQAETVTHDNAGVDVRRGYTDTKYGQLHYYQAGPVDEKIAMSRIPIVMLHQTPTSALEYGPFVGEMGKDRVALAIDTPGYGGSDGPTELPDINDYATAIAQGLRNLGYGEKQQVNIVGYHTGAFIAAEMAVIAPDLVQKIALVGVYDVAPGRYEKASGELKHPQSYAELLDQFFERLPKSKAYYSSMGIDDATWGKLRIDYLRSGLSRRYGHHAAYRYAAILGERLPKITQPVLLVAVGDSLREGTIASKRRFQNATLLDVPQIKGAIFYLHTKEIARHLRDFF